MSSYKHVGFLLEENTHKLALSVIKTREEDISTFIRRAIKIELARLGYLSEEEMKGLEESILGYKELKERLDRHERVIEAIEKAAKEKPELLLSIPDFLKEE